MSRVAPVVPAESDLLCEGCGYVLNGLPAAGNCPECGRPIAQSIGAHRAAPTWERHATRGITPLLRTTGSVLFRPTHFYRTLLTRESLRSARRFARVHWVLSSLLFGTAALLHLRWYLSFGGFRAPDRLLAIAAVLLVALTYLALDGTTRLAAWLTNWEATYRGIRLPYTVVLRGMYYHAAHYVPVAAIAAITVGTYQFLLAWRLVGIDSATLYLYVLCAEVILGAVYLFQTYWIGMRNMMYANR